MNPAKIFSLNLYIRKALNTFFPRVLFRLSPRQFFARNHWKSQQEGDIHGFDNYTHYHPRTPIILAEIRSRVAPDKPILDLGCNCGFYLSQLRDAGFGNLAGVDISPAAIRYGREHFRLDNVDLITGSFEEVLPDLHKAGRRFELTYSMGATLELVHPSFDLIGNICRVTDRYVVLIISEWGHAYPRFWEYEFNNNGFLLVKCITPYDGSAPASDPVIMDSLLVFERVRK
jgi:SAM-dependent methyltransferase